MLLMLVIDEQNGEIPQTWNKPNVQGNDTINLHSRTAMACTIDFRNLNEGFGGKTYKRKRQEVEAAIATATADSAMEVDDVALHSPVKRSAVPSSDDPDKPAFGKPTYDGVIAGTVSCRKCKASEEAARVGEAREREGNKFRGEREAEGDKESI
ncbi:hypothetical protein K2173_008826 [Erythroxylum novogranatense]|uniref:Coiled-coil domain-containing protein 86 n=1 Tax=Erythroxylum novogranatense TaxID=1862640 RepID=A0AAV8UD02_9ROSI|nr:hypothetical protein K2173_008826 [Erythroxylum novogranatense]